MLRDKRFLGLYNMRLYKNNIKLHFIIAHSKKYICVGSYPLRYDTLVKVNTFQDLLDLQYNSSNYLKSNIFVKLYNRITNKNNHKNAYKQLDSFAFLYVRHIVELTNSHFTLADKNENYIIFTMPSKSHNRLFNHDN